MNLLQQFYFKSERQTDLWQGGPENSVNSFEAHERWYAAHLEMMTPFWAETNTSVILCPDFYFHSSHYITQVKTWLNWPKKKKKKPTKNNWPRLFYF